MLAIFAVLCSGSECCIATGTQLERFLDPARLPIPPLPRSQTLPLASLGFAKVEAGDGVCVAPRPAFLLTIKSLTSILNNFAGAISFIFPLVRTLCPTA